MLNSGYSSLSKSNGSFKVDYGAGRFVVELTKEGYLTEKRDLELNEKSKYELGEISMVKLPDTTSVFVVRESDYLELPQHKMNVKDFRVPNGYLGVEVKEFS